MRKLLLLGALLALTAPARLWASAEDLSVTYMIKAGVVYQHASGVDETLDIYAPRGNIRKNAPMKTVPTVVFFHGGGWMEGSAANTPLSLMPWLERGWAAVSVNYRMGGQETAPAAIEDTRCAVWWVKRHAAEYGFDPDRIVLSGESAGAHLALITGMATADAGFDRRCPEIVGGKGHDRAKASQPELKVAGIVEWSGITDLPKLLQGPDTEAYALMWIGNIADPMPLARRVSPMSYVRRDLPPTLLIHGSADQVVPYSQALELHAALDKAGAPNELVTLKDREHFADFTPEDAHQAWTAIDAFLKKYVDPER